MFVAYYTNQIYIILFLPDTINVNCSQGKNNQAVAKLGGNKRTNSISKQHSHVNGKLVLGLSDAISINNQKGVRVTPLGG